MIKLGNGGQILAEVIVAIGIIVIVLVATASLMTNNTKTIRQNDTKDTAARMVEQQIQYYKSQAETNSTVFFASMPTGSCTWNTPQPTTTLATISCSVTSSNLPSGNGYNITVTATWTEGATGDRSVSLSASILKP